MVLTQKISRERLPQNIFTFTRARKSSVFSHFSYATIAQQYDHTGNHRIEQHM